MPENNRWTRDQKIKVAQVIAFIFIGVVGIIVTVILIFVPTEDKPALSWVSPKAFIPYFPEHPQVLGQKQAQIVAEAKLMEKRLANGIQVNFDIDNGAGQRVSSGQWHAHVGDTPLTFSVSDPGRLRMESWTSDIPNEIEN